MPGSFSAAPPRCNFDLNGDGAVTGADRVLLNRILNNLPVP
jgi:hypothetical protein